MALGNCIECKKEVSSDAKACPHCGKRKPLEKPPGPIAWMFALCFTAYILFQMYSFGSGAVAYVEKAAEKQRSIESSKPKEVVENSFWDASVYQVKDYLKNTLHDYNSSEFVEWSTVSKTPIGFNVRCKYRAKNLFGAMTLNNQVFYMDLKGNVVKVLDWK